jgi:enamine deaminase RidA (YjgF/YER057c/UK114 family)
MPRTLVSSGSPYEEPIGFSRAVRIGPVIAVSGTAPIGEDGTTVAPGDVYAQTTRCLAIIRGALEDAGGTLDDVVRTRVFLTDADLWTEAGRAHGDVFGDVRPASTFVEVSRLIDEDWLVEIEADAYVESAAA